MTSLGACPFSNIRCCQPLPPSRMLSALTRQGGRLCCWGNSALICGPEQLPPRGPEGRVLPLTQEGTMGLLAQGASDHPLPLGSVCPPSCFSSCRPWSVSRAVSWASSPSMCPRHPTYCVPQGRVIFASPSHLPLCWTISSGTTAGAPSGSQNSNSGPTHLNVPEVSLVVPPSGPWRRKLPSTAGRHPLASSLV